ncbi:transcription initiation factor IIE, beta subunit [Thozetella sp. PMI_491]|nr:transcription initiation factor IIE, beta subunit [Thozetella sp. PMI_491]
MSSFLERQQASFTGSMSAAASQIAGKKRALAPPSPSPSVTSTTSVPTATTPHKDRDHTPSVLSQPLQTGFGETNIAQMSYAIQWLRSKAGQPQTIHDVIGYLSIAGGEPAHMAFAENMRKNPRIEWTPDPNLSEQTWETGTYQHKPIINVKTKTELLAYLQARADATPVEVKDLKDGWPDCEKGINELELDHKILVIRAKKDGVPRLVWQDDASLHHKVDPQFISMWNRVEIPPVDSIVQRLKAVGQKATSDDPRDKAQAPRVEKKKKRAARRTGKATNLHMEHLLQDYSHYRK